jgi:hypothetical protein
MLLLVLVPRCLLRRIYYIKISMNEIRDYFLDFFKPVNAQNSMGRL